MIDWEFIGAQLQQQPSCNDVSLYKIGVYIGILTLVDLEGSQEGQLTSKTRKLVIGWLRLHAKEIGLASINQKDKSKTQEVREIAAAIMNC